MMITLHDTKLNTPQTQIASTPFLVSLRPSFLDVHDGQHHSPFTLR